MADEADESKESEPQGGGGSEGGGMPMGLFLGVTAGLSVLLLGGGFAIAYFVLPTRIASIVEKQQEEMLESYALAAAGSQEGEGGESQGGEGGESGEGGASSGGEGSAAAEDEGDSEVPQSEEFILSEIIVNLSGSRGGRYVKASMFFEGTKIVLGELEQNRPRVTDVVSEVLSSKTLTQFNSPGIRGELRRELIAAVNATLKRGTVENIYFESLLVQ